MQINVYVNFSELPPTAFKMCDIINDDYGFDCTRRAKIVMKLPSGQKHYLCKEHKEIIQKNMINGA